MAHTNTSIQIRKVIKKTLRWRVNIPHTVYVWAEAHEMHVSRVYVGYITTSLHGRLLGQREVFAILHNCIPLPSSALVGSPLPLSPYHLLYTLQLSLLSTLPSLLCGFLCQPFLPSNFYWLTNAVRWSWLACTLHKQPVCSYLGPFKTPRLHCHTHLHEIKHTQQCWTSLSHTHSHTHSCTHAHAHTHAFVWTWRTHL